ncbi:Prolyl oligopeptidase (plasmid) [Rhizobium grahamii CCGE 502]|uniref:Prolyl oligopeptidase n=1 Tax=Rhizobium grahamii CCGE 502 TaxID=990285 RepID=S3H4H9_9HYPH|nr:Prolyl oligopeptidase [Rhizobium grahamii CCGE 502]
MPDNDPWLEDIDGEKAILWFANQSARSLANFGGPRLEGRLRDAWQRLLTGQGPSDYLPRYISAVSGGIPRGSLWHRTTLAAYMTTEPSCDYRVVRRGRASRIGFRVAMLLTDIILPEASAIALDVD